MQRVIDRKLKNSESRIEIKISTLIETVAKQNNYRDIQHEYAEIKRLGEKVKQIDLKFLKLSRSIQEKNQSTIDESNILKSKLDFMET